MRYRVERNIPFSPLIVWSVLRDLRHFADNDPYHHDFRWLGERREGAGAKFGLRHSYAPIYPFASDEVACTVTEWEPGEAQTIVEANRRKYRSHTQRFTLTPLRFGSLVRFEVTLVGPPMWLLPWRLWVDFWALRRMRQKLADIETACLKAYNAAITEELP